MALVLSRFIKIFHLAQHLVISKVSLFVIKLILRDVDLFKATLSLRM